MDAPGTARSGSPMSRPTGQPVPLVFLFGLNDTVRELVRIRPNNQPQIVLQGTASFENHLTPGRFLKKTIWLDGLPRAQRVRVPAGGLINYIADPDSHGNALAKAGRIADSVSRPCFNPPRLVAETRRDQVADRLSAIDGLRVPRTVRLAPKHPRDFVEAMRAHGLSYPVIVRLAGDHGGVSTVRVERPDGWDAIHQLPWGGRSVYLTEFVDYRDADGLFRKHRIAMVRGRGLLRHVIIGSTWLLHRSERLEGARYVDEEDQRLRRFEDEALGNIRPTLQRIHEKIGLDYYGIDCHLADDGTLTLFEVNATMNILHNQRSPNRWDEPCARIRESLEQALIRHVARSGGQGGG